MVDGKNYQEIEMILRRLQNQAQEELRESGR
jgi:hypothetical protein